MAAVFNAFLVVCYSGHARSIDIEWDPFSVRGLETIHLQVVRLQCEGLIPRMFPPDRVRT